MGIFKMLRFLISSMCILGAADGRASYTPTSTTYRSSTSTYTPTTSYSSYSPSSYSSYYTPSSYGYTAYYTPSSYSYGYRTTYHSNGAAAGGGGGIVCCIICAIICYVMCGPKQEEGGTTHVEVTETTVSNLNISYPPG